MPSTIKNVPGRKTDVNDAVWIADLLAHGHDAATAIAFQAGVKAYVRAELNFSMAPARPA